MDAVVSFLPLSLSPHDETMMDCVSSDSKMEMKGDWSIP